MKDKALKQALEFLEQLGENHWGNRPDVIATIKEALAETDSEEIETLVYMAGLRDGKKMEREACAEVCKKHADVYAKLEGNPAAKSAWAACIDNRDAIRERGQA
jgi:hypothetical protein